MSSCSNGICFSCKSKVEDEVLGLRLTKCTCNLPKKKKTVSFYGNLYKVSVDWRAEVELNSSINVLDKLLF